MAEKCAADRRMARATTEIKPGGLPAAVAQYQNQPTPPLRHRRERGGGDPVLLDQLDQLAEVCDPGTKVVVIGAHNDIALYRELMRRGVSEYLVPPLQPLQLIGAITTLYADPAAPFVGRQIAFVGARGGVGLVDPGAQSRLPALRDDADQHGASSISTCRSAPRASTSTRTRLQGVADALSQPDRLDPVLLDRMMARCGEHLSLFAAPATLERDYDISAETFEEVTQQDPRIDALRRARPAARSGPAGCAAPAGAADDVVIIGHAGPGVAAQRQEHRRPGAPGPAQRCAAARWC